MGACVSAPAVRDEDGVQNKPEKSHSLPTSFSTAPSIASKESGRVRSLALDRLKSSSRAALQASFLDKVQGLQEQLALVSDQPLLGLVEAAELLAHHLQVDLVAFWTLSRDAPPRPVLLAAAGGPASVLHRRVVGEPRPPGAGGGEPRFGWPCELLRISDHAGAVAAGVPSELMAETGLRAMIQVPVGAPDCAVGALMVAHHDPALFDKSWWSVRLHVASMGLLPHVRHAQVEAMASLLRAMDETDDPVALISVLLRGAGRFMQRAVARRMAPRLALLQPGDAAHALLFEHGRGAAPSAPQAAGKKGRAAAGKGAAPRLVEPADAAAEVVASRLALRGTLLASSLANEQARYICDCSQYMQTCGTPARDVFTRSSDLVSAVVVVPLVADDGDPLGGIYFALDAPCEFGDIKDTLLGFISAVTPMLHNKLRGRAELLAAMIESSARRAISCPLPHVEDSARLASGPLPRANTAVPAAEPPLLRTGGALGSGVSGGSGGSSDGGSAAAGTDSVPSGVPAWQATPALPSASVSSLTKVTSKRINADAMFQVVQQELRSKSRPAFNGPELIVGRCLGRGGFGVVYRAWWHRAPVAAKVMPARISEREAMRDAVEMAVLSTVHHPNVVSVYSCLIDMVEDAGGSSNGDISCSGAVDGVRVRYRRLRPDEDPGQKQQVFNVVVMELCDRGTLRDAIKAGLLHTSLEHGAIGVRLAAAVEILLDVAYAVGYLHGMALVHGDIKLENVLLKSDASRPLGVTPKLADFGLTKILADGDASVNLDGAGTVTHLAPEMFRAGSRITKAVDAYAFGILMWEAYTAQRAFAGMQPSVIMDRVCRANTRPHFPSATPPAFAGLAQACWSANPASRPAFADIADRLQAMLDRLQPQPGPGGARSRPSAAALGARPGGRAGSGSGSGGAAPPAAAAAPAARPAAEAR